MATTGQAPAVHGLVAGNGLAVISLDRPRALNAMNLEMDKAYKQFLDEWSRDAAVKGVLVESTSSRAFSAGMDIKGVAAAVRENANTSLVQEVFQTEYSLICAISRYSKPYVSFMDGITMGFGLGLSAHGRYRIVTEKTVIGMPENGIGLFPDVGFAYLAAKTPGQGAVGAYLAITGARVTNPADALFTGLATHFVPSQNLPALKQALLKEEFSADVGEGVERVLSNFSEVPKDEPELKRLLPWIISCFGGGKSIVEIVDALHSLKSSENSQAAEWARVALLGIEKGAPFSLSLTRKHFFEVASAAASPGHELSEIEGVMRREHRLAVRMTLRKDFVEGVRAVLIDKDQKPKWEPQSLEEVKPADVQACFEALKSSSDELVL